MESDSYHLLVCGATFAGMGAAIAAMNAGRSVIVVERTVLLGREFIDTFNPGKRVGELTTSLGQHVEKDCYSRNVLSDDGVVHLAALHPLLCLLIKQYGVKCVFLTEILAVDRRDGHFHVLLHNASGRKRITVNEILDTSTQRLSQPGQADAPARKWLNSYLHHPLLHEAPSPPVPFHESMTIMGGRFASEVILQFAVNPEEEWQAARHKLHQCWKDRPDEWIPWTIAAIADTFMSHVHTGVVPMMNHWNWFPSEAFHHPLEALDKGYEFMSRRGGEHDGKRI